MPLLTTVAPREMVFPVTPRSVLPPLRPAAQLLDVPPLGTCPVEPADPEVVPVVPVAPVVPAGLPDEPPDPDPEVEPVVPEPPSAPDVPVPLSAAVDVVAPLWLSAPKDRTSTPAATISNVDSAPSADGPKRVMQAPVHG
jgi:hypothetical protein